MRGLDQMNSRFIYSIFPSCSLPYDSKCGFSGSGMGASVDLLVRSRGSTHFRPSFPTLFALHFVPSHAALAYCSFRFLVPFGMSHIGHRRPWGSYSCRVVRCRCLFAPMLGFPCLLLLWPVCAFGRLGRSAVLLS